MGWVIVGRRFWHVDWINDSSERMRNATVTYHFPSDNAKNAGRCARTRTVPGSWRLHIHHDLSCLGFLGLCTSVQSPNYRLAGIRTSCFWKRCDHNETRRSLSPHRLPSVGSCIIHGTGHQVDEFGATIGGSGGLKFHRLLAHSDFQQWAPLSRWCAGCH